MTGILCYRMMIPGSVIYGCSCSGFAGELFWGFKISTVNANMINLAGRSKSSVFLQSTEHENLLDSESILTISFITVILFLV
ncbi:unnamed protein product [Lathyrus oleraceus]